MQEPLGLLVDRCSPSSEAERRTVSRRERTGSGEARYMSLPNRTKMVRLWSTNFPTVPHKTMAAARAPVYSLCQQDRARAASGLHEGGPL